MHPKFKEAQAKREAASVTNARKLVDDLRHQVQHYKALSEGNSTGNSDVSSEEDSEGDWEDDDTAAAVNRDRRFFCVSAVISPSPTSLPFPVSVPTYLFVANMSEILLLATIKLDRKRARKAKINLVRKQKNASYLSFDTNIMSLTISTPSRVHFGVPLLIDHHTAFFPSVSFGCRSILRDPYSYLSSATPVSDTERIASHALGHTFLTLVLGYSFNSGRYTFCTH